jgi:hypothetical protein
MSVCLIPSAAYIAQYTHVIDKSFLGLVHGECTYCKRLLDRGCSPHTRIHCVCVRHVYLLSVPRVLCSVCIRGSHVLMRACAYCQTSRCWQNYAEMGGTCGHSRLHVMYLMWIPSPIIPVISSVIDYLYPARYLRAGVVFPKPQCGMADRVCSTCVWQGFDLHTSLISAVKALFCACGCGDCLRDGAAVRSIFNRLALLICCVLCMEGSLQDTVLRAQDFLVSRVLCGV